MSKNVALVLSSGGARGIAHIGVIQELEKSGYTITSIAGTSMGALVGGLQAKGSLPEFTEWLLKFTKMDVIKFMDLTINRGGLVKGEKIMKTLGDFFGESLIEDLPVAFACVAADLNSHNEIVFAKGDLLQAIRASISIPTVFQPVTLNGKILVDGGVINPLPLDLIKRSPDDMLIAVNVNANIPYNLTRKKAVSSEHETHYGKVRAMLNQRWSGVIEQYVEKYKNEKPPSPKPVNLFDVISESINLAQNKIASMYIEKYNPDLLIEVSHNSATTFDFYKSEELIEAGRKACRKALDKKAVEVI